MLVWFFDGMSWMGDDNQFPKLYEEVHGRGSWVNFMREIEGSVDGGNRVLAIYVPEIEGLTREIIAAERQ